MESKHANQRKAFQVADALQNAGYRAFVAEQRLGDSEWFVHCEDGDARAASIISSVDPRGQIVE